MTIIIAIITAAMFFLDAHPVALTVGVATTAWALALDTRELIKDRRA